jgi:predicted acylesterase/phospholipase RssA
MNEFNKQSCCVNQADGNLFRHLLRLFTSIRVSLGNTAMCLSGGGSLAMYHMGVVKALISLNCLPNVISGTSGGSIVAGVMAIFRNDELVNDVRVTFIDMGTTKLKFIFSF